MNYLDTDFVTLAIKEGVLYAWYKKKLIHLNAAMNIVTDRLDFSNGTDYHSIVDIRELEGVREDARKFLSSDIAIKGLLSMAIIINSGFIASIANVRYMIIKPPIPTKLFSSEEKAKEWINNLNK